jgi:hypothetical protein
MAAWRQHVIYFVNIYIVMDCLHGTLTILHQQQRSPLFVNEGSEPSYNTILDNRDPRVAFTFFRSGDVAYQGPWVPKTSLGSRTAYAPKKGFSVADQTINNARTTDRILIDMQKFY